MSQSSSKDLLFSFDIIKEISEIEGSVVVFEVDAEKLKGFQQDVDSRCERTGESVELRVEKIARLRYLIKKKLYRIEGMDIAQKLVEEDLGQKRLSEAFDQEGPLLF